MVSPRRNRNRNRAYADRHWEARNVSSLLQSEPDRQPAAYRSRRAGRSRAGRSRAGRGRAGRRLGVIAIGGALVASGLGVVVFALSGGAPTGFTGAATEIPGSVQIGMPQLAAEPSAAAMAASVPVRVEIPVLNVDAPVMRLGNGPGAAIQVPPLNNHNLAGWYDHSVTPGQDGTSVILGHVDTYAGTSVFYYIKTLAPGDLIKIVRADGSTAVFSVDGVQRVAKATFSASEIFGNTSYPELRLITCGGPFDAATRQYLDNIVVYSHLIR
jgi:LPXTG-site transpeptidase (sortase) family protein